jgi:hypothetical protein
LIVAGLKITSEITGSELLSFSQELKRMVADDSTSIRKIHLIVFMTLMILR